MSERSTQGPVELLLARHGESEGNVAATAASAAGAEVIDIGLRDADVSLTPTGRKQSTALGRWLADLPAAQRSDSVWCSPYPAGAPSGVRDRPNSFSG